MPDANAPCFRVPLVVGHDENQQWLDDSGLPAWGWVSALWRDGLLLVCDVTDVARQIADLVRAGRYARVSAEFYDEPPPDCPGRGLTLRRVALLGGDLPQVKGLADIPLPVDDEIRGLEIFMASTQRGRTYTPADLDDSVRNFRALSNLAHKGAIKNSERARKHTLLHGRGDARTLQLQRYVRLPRGAFAAFSEVTRMLPEQQMAPAAGAGAPDREGMVAKMADHGMDTSVIDEKVPDHVLAEMVRTCDAKDEGAKAVHPMDEDDEEKMPPPDTQEGVKMRERVKKWAERCRKMCAKYGEEYDEEEKKPEPAKMSEAGVKRLIAAELAKAERSADSKLGQLKRTQDAIQVVAFCEAQAAAGRLPPTEYVPKAAGGPRGDVYDRLMRADDREVMKFSEGGKTKEATERSRQMAELERRPTVFGELFRDAPVFGGAVGGAIDLESERVKDNYRANVRRFSEAGQTEDRMVKAFQAWRSVHPGGTAEEFLSQ